MSAKTDVFVSWEEHIISQEKGNRLVHFFLKNASGDLVLAVIGTERSIRHMIYIVADEYLQAYGSEGFINASTKWRARREVVDWLTSMVSKHQPSLDTPKLQSIECQQDMGYKEHSIGGTSGLRTRLPDHMVSRRLKVQNSDIVWSGVAWLCSKQLKHYPSFSRNETVISVHSFVFIMAEEESPYVGYLEDLYEDKKGQKKVKVRWFHQYKELKDIIPHLNPHSREVFITPHCQVISAECIDGPATVLTPKHYEKCFALVSHTLSAGIHMCFREFNNNKVKPFSLSKLRGYWNQAILTSLGAPLVSKHRAKSLKSNEEGEDLFHHDNAGRGVKRNSCGNQRLEIVHDGATNSIPGNQITKCEPTYKKLKIKLSAREPKSITLVRPEPPSCASCKLDEKIELLCQDSGIRGCWFRCKVLQASQKHLKVRYVDLQDADGAGYLEEWVPASRVAAPDKLGMRCSGRLTIRPWPPEDSSEHSIEVGAPVDAWWSDGWWEGVVTQVDISGSDSLQVYFPGDDRFVTIQRRHVRTSRDWVVNRWVDIKAKHDILSCTSSIVPKTYECVQSTSLDCGVFTNKHQADEEDKQHLSSLATSSEYGNVRGQVGENGDNTDKVDGNADKVGDNGVQADKVDDNADQVSDDGDAVGSEAKSVLDHEPVNLECIAEEREEVPLSCTGLE